MKNKQNWKPKNLPRKHSSKYNDWKAGIFQVPIRQEQRISRKAIKLAENEYYGEPQEIQAEIA